MSLSSAPLLRAVETAPERAIAAGRAVRSGTLTNLQVLRAAAALAVALFHAAAYVRGSTGDRSFLVILDSRLGMAGVALFFAISGFLMARLVRSTEPWRFLAHRVLRIFPGFLILAISFSLLAPLFGLSIGLNLLSLTLAPAGNRAYPLGVEWTLVLETTFYVVLFGLALIRLARVLELIAVGWLALLLILWFAAPGFAGGLSAQTILLSPANLAFAAGLLLPWLLERRLFPAWLLPAALPLIILCSRVSPYTGYVMIGAAAAIIVGCALQMPQLRQRHWLAGALVRLGDNSYVLYLIHVPVITSVLAVVPSGWPAARLWSLSVALSLALAALIGPAELALYRRLRGWADRTSRVRLCGFGLAYLAVFLTAASIGSTQAALEDRRVARVERSLAQLPTTALGSRESVAAAITEAGRAIPGQVRGALEQVVVLADGRVFLSGWAFAEAEPRAELYMHAFCGGRLIGARRASRLRPEIRHSLGPAAGRAGRIGFTVPLEANGCAAGEHILAVAADDDGRLALLPGSAQMPAAASGGKAPLP